jgi:hypothetical protein
MEEGWCEAYSTLMQTVLKEEFPQFLEALEGQNIMQQHHGKVALIDFDETGIPSIKRIKNSTELCAHFHSQGENRPTTNIPTIRQLYILEDLDERISRHWNPIEESPLASFQVTGAFRKIKLLLLIVQLLLTTDVHTSSFCTLSFTR